MLAMLQLEVHSAHPYLLSQEVGKLFKYPRLGDKFDLHCVLTKGDQLFKSTRKFRYLEIEDKRF